MLRKTKVEHADTKVADAAAPLRHTLPVKVLGQLSEIADQPPLIALSGALFAIGLATRDRRLASAGGRMLATELLATAIKSAIKHRVDRTRPRVVADGGDYAFEGGGTPATELSSFPSGHTAGAVGVARALSREFSGARSPSYAAAGAIAAIQVPRSQHYVSDLVAGAAIGLIAEAAVHGLEKLLSYAATPQQAGTV